jgi:hypothetical protein
VPGGDVASQDAPKPGPALGAAFELPASRDLRGVLTSARRPQACPPSTRRDRAPRSSCGRLQPCRWPNDSRTSSGSRPGTRTRSRRSSPRSSRANGAGARSGRHPSTAACRALGGHTWRLMDRGTTMSITGVSDGRGHLYGCIAPVRRAHQRATDAGSP